MRFQFLIGTVKTSLYSIKYRLWFEVSIPHRYCKNTFANGKEIEVIYMFQFLIGTVKTKLYVSWAWFEFWFQFLIGTVKTLYILSLFINHSSVSIPHRYFKNSDSNNVIWCPWNVSIPHRYCKNLLSAQPLNPARTSFNSS